MVASIRRPTEAWRGKDLLKSGFGQVIIARFKASGEVEAGVFLLDPFCLGVKNAFFARMTIRDYEDRLLGSMDRAEGRVSMSPACARKLVEGAAAYARSLGLEPHPDYRLGARVFGGIDPAECQEEFVYGESGKPLYVQSPHDSPLFAARVMNTLRRRLGEGGFHYMLFVGSGSGPAATEQDDDRGDSPRRPA